VKDSRTCRTATAVLSGLPAVQLDDAVCCMIDAGDQIIAMILCLTHELHLLGVCFFVSSDSCFPMTLRALVL
jgi:hypothetical protein